ncbi:MAG TPA: ACP S-malonyltransferase [Phycisphaerae bacterium]|nr:ACP S-malonyltransferase [Phycisphaerae bacterium]
MGKTALLFPGQGAQSVGMGADLYEASPRARELFDLADRLLGFKLSAICFEGPEERLNATDVSQPAIFVTSVALAECFAAGAGRDVKADAAAGLSLGEYTALWAAGALSFEDGVRLTRRRGELMQAAADANPSTMVSIMGLDEGQVKNICEAASALGIISPANFNCPGQIVVSGTKGACAKALTLAEEAGGRAVELKVAGAFHSQLMASAAEGLACELGAIALGDLRVPVVANVTADYYGSSADIQPMLVRQLTGSILWQKSMERLLADGFDTFYEIGPGRVLRGLMKKIDRGAAVTGVNGAAETGAC